MNLDDSLTVASPTPPVNDPVAAPTTAPLQVSATDIDTLVAGVERAIEAQSLPVATYRVQFNRNFTFTDAEQLADYWTQLGISHLYASPFLQAREGSLSGYDVVDYSAINAEIGTRGELESLAGSLRARQL